MDTTQITAPARILSRYENVEGRVGQTGFALFEFSSDGTTYTSGTAWYASANIDVHTDIAAILKPLEHALELGMENARQARAASA